MPKCFVKVDSAFSINYKSFNIAETLANRRFSAAICFLMTASRPFGPKSSVAGQSRALLARYVPAKETRMAERYLKGLKLLAQVVRLRMPCALRSFVFSYCPPQPANSVS